MLFHPFPLVLQIPIQLLLFHNPLTPTNSTKLVQLNTHLYVLTKWDQKLFTQEQVGLRFKFPRQESTLQLKFMLDFAQLHPFQRRKKVEKRNLSELDNDV